MSLILVSLISDQTIPNVLFIRDQPKAAHYIFISTEKMEKRMIVTNIIKACPDLVISYNTIVVEEDSLSDFEQVVESGLDRQDDFHYLVNITGGTKIMSLAAYLYFTKIGSSEIFYLPLGKSHFRQIYPMKKNKIKEISFRINLQGYLEANGVTVQSKAFAQKNRMIRHKDRNEQIMNAFVGDGNLPIKKMVEYFRTSGFRDKKNLPLSDEIKLEMSPILAAGFMPENPENLNRDETNYLTGDWFEEFTYEVVQRVLDKDDSEIGKGIRVTRGEKTSNEFDVMFTHKNALYVIECKTDVADNEEGKLSQLFTSTLYKASTLKKDFGLFVKYYLFSVNDFSKLSPEQKDRARVLDINLVGIEILSNEERLIEFISKM
jgi:hypothetical protein